MRYLWATVCAVFLSMSTPAYTGGMSGGTGIGGLIAEITEQIQKILKNPAEIDPEEVRRLIMRLWAFGKGDLKVGNTIIHVEWVYKPGDPANADNLSFAVISISSRMEASAITGPEEKGPGISP